MSIATSFLQSRPSTLNNHGWELRTDGASTVVTRYSNVAGRSSVVSAHPPAARAAIRSKRGVVIHLLGVDTGTVGQYTRRVKEQLANRSFRKREG